MRPVTEAELRAAFVNTSKGEAKRASVPDVKSWPAEFWQARHFIGWTDEKRPKIAYVAMELDGELVVLQLRKPATKSKRMICSWCRDTVKGDEAVLFVTPRVGESGRAGNTLGTAICSDFACCDNARREPNMSEMNSSNPDERQFWIDLRVHEMEARSIGFVRQVCGR